MKKNSALYRNYSFLNEKISESPLTLKKLHEAIYQLKIVSILLQDENPQEIIATPKLALKICIVTQNFFTASYSATIPI